MTELPETFVPGFHDENVVKKMKYFQLGNTGMKVSQISLGAGGFCLQYGHYTIDECRETIHEAIKSGINYIDTAPWYGHRVSEEVLGYCLEGIPRKSYYLATKVGRYEKDPESMFDFSAKKTEQSIEISLKKLGLDYIDVLQVHDVEFALSQEIVFNETLPVIKKAVEAKKVKFIGITGYPVSTLADYIKNCQTAHFDTVLTYCRLSLIDNELKKYTPFFHSKKLGIINAASHCMGLLSSSGPQDWHPASQHIKDICTEARDYCKANNVELGKLALFYSIQQPEANTHLVGINTRELLKTNLDVVYNGLNKQELEVNDYVKNKILTKLTKTNWEQVEVDAYWKAVKG